MHLVRLIPDQSMPILGENTQTPGSFSSPAIFHSTSPAKQKQKVAVTQLHRQQGPRKSTKWKDATFRSFSK